MHTPVTCSLDLMIHLCSGWNQSGPHEVPNLSPTIATSPWKSAAGTPSMAGLSAHKDSMMAVESSRSIMQSFMAARLIFPYLRHLHPPWKFADRSHARRCFQGLGSSAMLVMQMRRHTMQFQPRVGPLGFAYICILVAKHPKSTAKSIGLCGTRMASRVRLANGAWSKGQLTGGCAPYL